MPKGFFSESNFMSSKETSTIPHCGLCGLYKNCLSPKMKYEGKGKKKILIVSGAPRKYEDQNEQHLIGDSREILKRALRKNGINLKEDCWTTSALICRVPENIKPNTKQMDEKIESCRPNLLKTIKELNPKAIILLGSTATKSLIPHLFKSEVNLVKRWGDYYIPCRKPNAWITSIFYPSNIIYERNSAAKVIFQKWIDRIIEKSKKRPWSKIPDYENQIEIIMNPAQAAKEIKRITKKGGNISFDYETNCLKPEIEDSKIYSCSVCWGGKKTIAFPWRNEVIDAMSILLKAPIGKIAANLKFENRWTKIHLGHWVKYWIHDTMIAAHVLNNNPKVTSLTFQAFVQLGMPCYDQSVKPYLKQKGNSKLNRIDQIDLKDLLLYNGLDSLLEFRLAQIQMKEFKRRLK